MNIEISDLSFISSSKDYAVQDTNENKTLIKCLAFGQSMKLLRKKLCFTFFSLKKNESVQRHGGGHDGVGGLDLH